MFPFSLSLLSQLYHKFLQSMQLQAIFNDFLYKLDNSWKSKTYSDLSEIHNFKPRRYCIRGINNA